MATKKKTASTTPKKAVRKDHKLARAVLKARIALLGRALRGKAAAKLDSASFNRLYNELQARTADLAKLR